jgi:S-formylglutathione hydrolase FrmB
MRRRFLASAISVLTCLVLWLVAAEGTRAADPAVSWDRYIVKAASTGKIERFWVGRPASLKSDGKYPVMYFLPGLLDGDDTWKDALSPHLGRYEMIAVCPSVGGSTWFMNSPAQPWMRWGDYLTEDLRGFVEGRYPASREKGQRGIAGISAGGHAAFYHALRRPDLYGSVSVLSGAVDLRGYAGAVGLDYWIGPRDPATLPLYAERSCLVLAGKLEAPPPFALYLDAGDKDGALAQMEALRKVLDARQVKYKWFVGAGSHDWTYWTSRAADHLAWHAEQFAENRRESRYTEQAPAKAAELEILKTYPDISPCDEAVRRLQAPWNPAPDLEPVTMAGLPAAGGPLSRTEAKFKELKLSANLTARGHKPGLWVYRLTLRAASPLPRDGTVALSVILRNGRGLSLLVVPLAALPVPAGDPQRRVDLRARLAVELKPPDPLRGGIAIGLQVFDAAGKPRGNILVAKAYPGSIEAERWPIAPEMRSEWVVSLTGDTALPLAAIHEASLAAEPPAP